jgi:hypothetical protein
MTRPDRHRRAHSVPRLIIINSLLGVAAGALCATIVLAVDLAGLRSLLMRGDSPWIAIVLLYGGFAFTFGGLVAASAVMMMSDK